MAMETRRALFSVAMMMIPIHLLSVPNVQANSCPYHVKKVQHSDTAVHNHVCYLFVNNELYWSKARDKCWDLGGEMLTVENQETMDFIKKKLHSRELSWNREGVWLGAYKKAGKWRWTNGRMMNYTNWAPGEPSNLLGILSVEDCAQMRDDDGWKWHDIPCGALSFHYNYVCQFPAIATTTTLAATTAEMLTSTHASFNLLGPHSKFKSEDYKQLTEELFQIMRDQGLSISYGVHSPSGESSALNTPSDVSGRVSSSAANQAEDNGNSSVLAIIITISTSLLLLMSLAFMLLYYRQRQSKQKAATEVPVHFTNNTYSRAPNGSAHRNGQVLPRPSSQARFASNDELYLDPQRNDRARSTHVSNSSLAKQCKCYNQQTGPNGSICSSPGTDSELGVCGGSDPEQEIKMPLMAASAAAETADGKVDCQLVGSSCEACQSMSSCCALNQGGYVDMKSLTKEMEKTQQAAEEDGKHTYSNVDHRDTGVENIYEALP